MRISRPTLALLLALAGPAACDSAAASADPEPAPTAQPAATSDTASAALLTRADLGRIDGAESAKVWVIVISDFQCPFCKRWHEQTGTRLHTEYVRSGKIRVAYLNLPISSHRNAGPAHEAAMCAAEQGAFWPLADALFATQDQWKSRLTVEPYFDSLAVRHVADDARYHACITSGAVRPLIEADVSRIQRIGVSSTPTFVIGQQVIVGAQPYEVFQRAIDAALAAAPAR